MGALNDLVRLGKVRYIGASSGYAWQFQKANTIAERNGWAKFVSMQNLYNLIYREEEREMIPYCYDSGIASIHWSPLARGLLTGKSRESIRETSDRGISLFFAKKENENDGAIIDRVIEIAEKYKHSPAQVKQTKKNQVNSYLILLYHVDCFSMDAFQTTCYFTYCWC
jgi:aryl-alcohol dehydrogenase-like predicted oxidoreductase